MNANFNNEIAAMVKEHRWQDVLRNLPPNEPIPLSFETIADMDNLRSVAARLNSKGEDANRYSFSNLNYALKCIIALATPKQNGQVNPNPSE